VYEDISRDVAVFATVVVLEELEGLPEEVLKALGGILVTVLEAATQKAMALLREEMRDKTSEN
jgi:hypothetical protein